jgi:hypothetical protein
MLALLVLSVGSAALAAGGGGKPGTSGPAGVPYLCSDGQPLRVSYEGGGFRAKAKLLHGGHSYELATAATIEGLRYASTDAAEEAMVWSTDGLTGVLSAVPAGQAGTGAEREIARCTRVGWSGEPVEAAAEPGHAAADTHH